MNTLCYHPVARSTDAVATDSGNPGQVIEFIPGWEKGRLDPALALKDIPDPQTLSHDAVIDWLEERVAALRAMAYTPAILETFAPLEVHESFEHPCGPEAFPLWRKFFLATLLADWIAYDGVNRIDWPRHHYIMTSAYRYARLWCVTLPDGTIVPVGQTLGYPIPKFLFESVLRDMSEIDDRGVFLPLRHTPLEKARYIYALNISIVKPLWNTIYSQRLIRAYRRDAARMGNVGVMAITVDEVGQKFSRLAGFRHHGDVIVQGERESLYVRMPE